MTADLPEWVLKRLARALDQEAFDSVYAAQPVRQAWAINQATAALAEFLAILEECEYSIVPLEAIDSNDYYQPPCPGEHRADEREAAALQKGLTLTPEEVGIAAGCISDVLNEFSIPGDDWKEERALLEKIRAHEERS